MRINEVVFSNGPKGDFVKMLLTDFLYVTKVKNARRFYRKVLNISYCVLIEERLRCFIARLFSKY